MNCPNCRGLSVAEIFWGYPGDVESMQDAIDKKEIVLGGCCVTDHDPKWECNDCGHQWGERDE